MGSYELEFAQSLLLTIALESAAIVIISRYYLHKTFPPERVAFAGIFPSLATLPYVWFLFPLFFRGDYTGYMLFSELTVTLVETLILRMLLPLGWREALLLSVGANTASFGIGWLIHRLHWL